jgi:hypothetical protein
MKENPQLSHKGFKGTEVFQERVKQMDCDDLHLSPLNGIISPRIVGHLYQERKK